MPGPVKLIDAAIKDEVLRFPTVELIRRLFPEVSLRGRSVICNPLRGEKHPSLSCYRAFNGYQMWKDHATGESGDNISFYRKVYPSLGYVEAIDRLSLLVLGKSALQDFVPGVSVPVYSDVRRQRAVHIPVLEEPSALSIVRTSPFSVESAPSFLVNYNRERAISDMVAGRFLDYVVYENNRQKGRSLIDPSSGLPMVDGMGNIIKDDALYEAVGMRNDIGGYSLRVPASKTSEGFKGANASFITTIPACDKAAYPLVSFVGTGDGFVTGFAYNAEKKYFSINRTQGFIGVEPYAVSPVAVFLDGWTGRYLEGRDLRCAAAVISSLNRPMTQSVDLVEGMYDAMSVIELDRISGAQALPVRDIVVLNSISNIQWAVPYLACHSEVRSLLDNDMRSSAGKKAYDAVSELVAYFRSRLGGYCLVRSDSALFYPHKDINDYLKARKGFSHPDSETLGRVPDRRNVKKAVFDKRNNGVKP